MSTGTAQGYCLSCQTFYNLDVGHTCPPVVLCTNCGKTFNGLVGHLCEKTGTYMVAATFADPVIEARRIASTMLDPIVGEWRKKVEDLQAELDAARKTCVWYIDRDEQTDTCGNCGLSLAFEDGDAKENGYKFCPGCGAKIELFEYEGEENGE